MALITTQSEEILTESLYLGSSSPDGDKSASRENTRKVGQKAMVPLSEVLRRLSELEVNQASLKASNASLKARNAKLEERNAKLEERVDILSRGKLVGGSAFDPSKYKNPQLSEFADHFERSLRGNLSSLETAVSGVVSFDLNPKKTLAAQGVLAAATMFPGTPPGILMAGEVAVDAGLRSNNLVEARNGAKVLQREGDVAKLAKRVTEKIVEDPRTLVQIQRKQTESRLAETYRTNVDTFAPDSHSSSAIANYANSCSAKLREKLTETHRTYPSDLEQRADILVKFYFEDSTRTTTSSASAATTPTTGSRKSASATTTTTPTTISNSRSTARATTTSKVVPDESVSWFDTALWNIYTGA